MAVLGPTSQATIALLIVVGLPTLAIAITAWRRSSCRYSAMTAVAIGAVVSFSTWVILAEILARLDILTRPATWTVAAVSGVGSTVWLGREASLWRRAARQAPSTSEAQEDRLRDRLIGAGTSLMLLIPCAPYAAQIASRRDSLSSPTAWYYLWISRTIAQLHGIPDHMHEWGLDVKTFTYHIGFNASSAYLVLAGGDDRSLAAAQLVRLTALLSASFGVYVFVRALGASRIPAIASSFGLLTLDIYGLKLASYRPESLGYGLAFASLGLIIEALDRDDRTLLYAGGLGLVGVSQVHTITAAFAGCVGGGAALAYLIFGAQTTSPRWPTGPAARRRRARVADELIASGPDGQGRAIAGVGAVGDASGAQPVAETGSRRLSSRVGLLACFVAVVAIVSVGFNLIATGRTSAASSLGGVPHRGPDGADPTWAFLQLGTAGVTVDGVGFGAPSSASIVRQSLDQGFLTLSESGNYLFAGAVYATAALMSLRRREARKLLVLLVVSLAAIALFASLLSLGGDTYVPRRTGYQRVLQLWFVLPLAGAAVVASLFRRIRVVAAGLVLIGAVVIWFQALPDIDRSSHQQPSIAEISTAHELPITPGATVLTNAWTQGYVSVMTPGYGLLDGHAPYLEADLLVRTNNILTQGRAYFASPSTSPFPFAEFNVRYVLVSTRQWSLGTPSVFPTLLEEVNRDPQLRLVASTEGLVLYEVQAVAS